MAAARNRSRVFDARAAGQGKSSHYLRLQEPKKFKKIVVLDTVIFYPEHEKLLTSMVEKPVLERVPLRFDDRKREWCLPDGYELPAEANIIIWPSSLPETIDHIPLEVHGKLKTAQCWAPAVLQESVTTQNLLNRIQDACCVITCWTNIPDEVLDFIQPRAIITWTHEFEHRLNIEKAKKKGIYTNCVPDYGTEAVAELQWDGLLKLIERNKSTTQRASTPSDVVIGVLRYLFDRYRKAHLIEKNTRRGKFSHQFHKIGRSQMHYGSLRERPLDEVIPHRLIEGKTIGLLGTDSRLDYLAHVLSRGFHMHVGRSMCMDHDSAAFYKFLAEHETIVFDSAVIRSDAMLKIRSMHAEGAVDIQILAHYREELSGRMVGVIGMGRIGQAFARTAWALGMNVQYTGPNRKDIPYDYVALDTLLKSSHVVSVNVKAHVARGLISRKELDQMPEGTYFINTSDGNAVDQSALTAKMLHKELFAALDVYPGLPTTGTLCLDENPTGNVKDQLSAHVLTYRAGWITQESVRVKTYKLLGHMMTAMHAEAGMQKGGK